VGSAIRIKQTNVPRQSGEQARLKVVQGPDYGATYVLTGAQASVGRGEDADVVISDLKASRKHATLTMGAAGWSVKDLGSANGILHNGKNTRSANLKSNDTITLGETTLEFMASEQGTQMLVAPPRSLSQLQAEQAAFAAQKKKVGAFSGDSGAAGGAQGGLLKNKKVLLAVGGAAVIFLMLPDDNKPAKKPPKRDPAAKTENLEQYLPGANVTDKSAEQFFKEGFREFTSGNYMRAKTQFETVLQMNPSHRLSLLYLENADKAIKEDVKKTLEAAKKNTSAGRLREARGNYESVLRMLFKDQTDPSYIEAKDQLDKVNKMIAGVPVEGTS
jgi:hypothetical protein